MWKIVLKKIGMWLVNIGLTFIFNTIDKNKDGSISKKEINNFVNLIKEKLKKKKN